MRKLQIFLPILFLFTGANGQDLGAYSDFRGRFYIFDQGKSILVEDQPVQDFQIGGNCVLYLDKLSNLKLYQEGRIRELEVVGVSKIYATDFIAAYTIFEKLKVIEEGEPVTLCHRCPIVQVEDSLIVFFDENKASLRVYYNGNTEAIENGLLGLPVSHLKSSDNIVAYISSSTRDFKIYYKGELHTLIRHVDRVSHKAGKDIVAYIHGPDNTFNVFYKGEIIQLETFPPTSFRMGDGFVAYVDDMGYFKVFYRGKTIELSGYAPDSYICEDNLLLYSEYNYLKLFYKGEIYEVEAFLPSNFTMDWNTITYTDPTNRVWMFSGGEKQFLTNDLVEKFEIYRDLIVLNLSMDRNLIYYKGKMYEGDAY